MVYRLNLMALVLCNIGYGQAELDDVGKKDSFSISDTCTWTAEGGEYFADFPEILYKGVDSRDPLSYRFYNAEEVIMGKTMKEWLRFSIAYWHTITGDGSDPFGAPTKAWPWESDSCSKMHTATRRMHAMFEFMHKLGVDRWCFHDRDIAPEGATLAETNANLDQIVGLAESLQEGTSIRPLWGTAQLFKHPRYMNGAATSPQAEVFAYAAAQVKKAMDVSHRLGAENYVFWGGREGYQTLLNTDLEKELKHMASFLRMADAYKKKIGFNGTLLLEPKPQEPTKHQYDWDVGTTVGFLRQHDLQDKFKINVECNHATLAGHSCEHELELARVLGMLGNLDANTGDAQTGWDTDQFMTDPRQATLVMAVVLKQGGLAPGGINFDAKLRRESIDLHDLFSAHIGGIDALARGLRNAAKLLEEGILMRLVEDRYLSFEGKLGSQIEAENLGFEELEEWALANRDPVPLSGKQELAENILNMFVR